MSDEHAGSAKAVLGAMTSAMGAITSYQVEFDYWLRQLGTCVAILAGGLTVIHMLRQLRKP